MKVASKPDDLLVFLRTWVAWSEENNVYRRGAKYISRAAPAQQGSTVSADIQGVERWLEMWKLPAGKSIEGEIRFKDRPGSSDASPLVLDSVNNPPGPRPIDAGALAERLGPGRPIMPGVLRRNTPNGRRRRLLSELVPTFHRLSDFPAIFVKGLRAAGIPACEVSHVYWQKKATNQQAWRCPMFRSFRPALETLEKREVFSAGPLVGLPMADELAAHIGVSAAVVVVSDFNNEGNLDLAVKSPRDAASGLPTGARNQILPCVEQENLCRSSSDQSANVVFNPNSAQSQIIAILIGLVQEPKQTPMAGQYVEEVGVAPHTPKNNLVATTFGRGIVGDWNGDGRDDIELASRQAAAAHDAVFAEIGSAHSLPEMRRKAPGIVVDPTDPNVIYAKKNEDIVVENDETHFVGQDRTNI